MEKIKHIIKKNKPDVIFLACLNLVLFIVGYLSLFTYYFNYSSFDLQALLLWDYSAKSNIIPYKDIYYPYGFLTYYKNVNIFATIAYLVLPLISFNILIFSFAKIVKRKHLTFIFSITLMIIILFLIGTDSFYRYGIALSAVPVLSFLFFKKDKLNLVTPFIIGIITFSFLWLVHDQGVYLFLLSLIYYLFFKYKQIKRKQISIYIETMCEISIFAAGGIIVSIPFIVYLITNNALDGFLYYIFVSTPEFPELSKTPFFTSFTSFNNLFSYLVLSIVGLLLANKILLRQKLEVINYVEFGFVVLLLFLEQKNIIRATQLPIMLVAYILFIFLLYDVTSQVYIKKINKTIFGLGVFLVVIAIFYTNFNILKINNYKHMSLINFSDLERIINITASTDQKMVVEKLNSYNTINHKVYSFPADPVFYALLKQEPPLYQSIYEASSKKSQEQLIDYLLDVDYIVLNTNNISVQDTVPNYVRAKYLLRYILTNYSIKDTIGEYLILEKKRSDFFATKLSENQVKTSLLKINLENIPRTEGIYNSNIINDKRNHTIIQSADASHLNNYLASNKVESRNLIIVLKNNNYYKNKMHFTVDNKIKTEVVFNSCYKTNCIINLESIPAFYNIRVLSRIDTGNDVELTLLRLDDDIKKIIW